MMKRVMKPWVVVMGLVMMTACSAPAAQAPSTQTQKLKAVATFSIIADFVQNVAGDKIDLTAFVGADADVHDFEPTPSDVAKLAGAQLIFENGIGLESWLDNLYKASGSQAQRVVLANGVALIDGDNAGHAHAAHDPHIWQDPRNAMQMVKSIRDALVQADPNNANTYQQNADAYLAKLAALDGEIMTTVNTLPKENRKLVTSHDALGYFAQRYGFEIVGSVIASLSTEAGEPSAQDIVALVNGIRQQGVKAIFLESQSNPKLVERVASEAGVVIGPELYTDALGATGSAGATYIDAMRHNARVIVEALK
jgi:ABC-type Zn uptake system ZnuABC Zn-binding protein ZnuA